MDTRYKQVLKKLKKYNQENLLIFYHNLHKDQKQILLSQIENIDIELLKENYKNCLNQTIDDNAKIETLNFIYSSNIKNEEKIKYFNLGEKIIKENKYVVVTMAGGQGTRLGLAKPKGCFELELKSDKKKSLFEILCDNFKIAYEKYKVYIEWYIMTSSDNDSDTQNFFKTHNYFNYPKEKIHFFVQENMPILDLNGNMVLDKEFKIKEVSNGNGNVFYSLKKNGILNDLKKRNVEYIFFCGIDNVLLKAVDPLFIGMLSDSNYKIASKTVEKLAYEKNSWIFARKNNVISLISPKRLSNENLNKKEFKQINILEHLLKIDALEECCNMKLPYHIALKKNNYLNEEGVKVVAKTTNTYKFEQFIFDIFEHFDNMLILNVKRKDEFAPIKSFTRHYTPDNAIKLYLKVKNKNI